MAEDSGDYGNPDDIMEQAKRDAAIQPGIEVVVRLGENEIFKVTYVKPKDHFECTRCVSRADIGMKVIV